jgi:hypothetical protein
MAVKIVSGIVAVALVLAYVVPPALKLKHVALAIVITVGVVMMLIDLWQSLKEGD